MRAKSKIYHIECFKCIACEKQLKPGDEFALREEGALYCKADHDQIEQMKSEQTQLTELTNISSSKQQQQQQLPSQSTIRQTLRNLKRSASSDFGSISGNNSIRDCFEVQSV